MKSRVNVNSLGTILGIWAHPDDETWAAAGLMSAAIANGQKAACVIATKGGAGQTADERRWPQAELARIRETELGQALAVVGVHDLYWLNYQDGQLAAADDKKAVQQLVKLINKIRPDSIVTFEPKGITGHDDHKTVCRWARQASKKADRWLVVYGACETRDRYEKVGKACDKIFDIYFNIKEPFTIKSSEADLRLKLTLAQTRLKMEALKAHQSQTSQLFASSIGKKYLRQLSSEECFIKLS